MPEGDPDAFQQLAQALGVHPALVGLFVKLDSTFTADTLTRKAHAIGAEPLITLEPWSWRSLPGRPDPTYSLATLVRGDHDPALAAIAEQIRAYGKPVLLRFAHEMNGTWYPWASRVNGNSAARYVAAWQHVHVLFTEAGASNVRWVWAPNIVGRAGGEETQLRALYPGDDWVNFVGLTGYGHEPSAGETFDTSLAALRELSGKPILLTEVGADGPNKGEWVRSFGPWLEAQSDVIAFVWFNTDPVTVPGATGDYRLDDTPSDLLLFKAMLRSIDRLDRVMY